MVSKLVTEPIPRLIKQIALPASIGFFFNTMFNVVDTFWAGQISVEALAALSISFPVFFLILAMGSGVSQGSTALIANALGRKDKEKAKEYAAQAVSFAIILSVLMMIIGLLAAPWLFRFLGAEEQYLQTALAYINVIYYGIIFFLLTYVLNASLVAEGDTTKFRNFLIIGFILNLILDPWFMFGGFGLPAMGVAGIGLATVLVQAFGMFYMFYHVCKTGLMSVDTLHHLKPKLKPFKEIAIQGFPASLNMMTVALGIFVITFFISKFGKSPVAAYGIATRVEQIILLPTIGLNMATLSLVGQNNGAGRLDRVKEIMKKASLYGTYIMIPGTFILYFLGGWLMGFFTDDLAVVAIGATYLKIAAFAPYAYMLLFVLVSGLQGMKRPMYALFLGAARQIIGPIILFALFTKYWGLVGIWWAVFVITWAAAIFTVFYVRHVVKKAVREASSQT